ncbi:helix-turn-helix domain-containing protein [Caldalkalibacillus mannanilyticus]|uniref:helix-turn-helix domain-containing protein n=1 Tax=Caldalkalibacillus mannanilyticus TaxID=1418 RepID=UPI00046AAF4E|nr:helix-turn-helix transcriptional regulator [Caldalkalibacillus mannanilyticus]
MEKLKERLRQLRKSNHLTQKEIATFLGISESAYGYYEQGRNEPSIETLKKLADKYNVSFSYISGESDDPNASSIFPEYLNDPEINIFFKDYLSAPQEKQEELRRFWEFIKNQEKNRMPGDKQGE